MNVAYVIDTYPRKSELFIRREIEELVRQGVHITVFSLCRADRVQDNVERSETHPVPGSPNAGSRGINIIYLPRFTPRMDKTAVAIRHIAGTLAEGPKHLAARVLRSPAAAALASALTTGKFDVVHAHFLGVASTIALAASRMTGVPLTISAHANDIFCTGEGLPAKGRHARKVFACCQSNVEELATRHIPKEKIEVSYHGIPGDFAADAAPVEKEIEKPRIVALGRFVEKKGFKYLVSAVRELKHWGITPDCAIYGDGPLGSRLRDAARTADVAGCIEFPGWVEGGETSALYTGAHVLVCPSVVAESGDRDGIPNVIIEAMALGIPVVATRVGGIPEAIKDESTGMLVPPNDHLLLAEAVNRILSDTALREKITQNARARAATQFDITKNVAAFLDTWQELS
ncbi:glycosyltransferase [Planctomycetota bacterium]